MLESVDQEKEIGYEIACRQQIDCLWSAEMTCLCQRTIHAIFRQVRVCLLLGTSDLGLVVDTYSFTCSKVFRVDFVDLHEDLGVLIRLSPTYLREIYVHDRFEKLK